MTTTVSYPFVRGDALYFKHPQGAVVKDVNGSYLIKGETVYDWLAALTPLMNGSHSIDQIRAEVPRGTESTAEQLIDLLVSRGTARLLEDVTEGSGTSSLTELEAFLANWSAAPRTDADRFRAASIAVFGDDDIATAYLENLQTNGARHAVPVQDVDELQRSTWDWVFATTANSVSALYRLSEQAVSGAFRLLCVFTLDNKVITGPVIDQDSPVQGIGAVANLLLRNASDSARFDWGEYEMLGRPMPTDLNRAVAEIVGVNAAFETFREITGVLPSRLRDAALVVDEFTLDSAVERVIDPFLDTDSDTDSITQPELTARQYDSQEDLSGQNELDTLLALTSPNTGIFAGFNDEQYVQEPLFVARIQHGWTHPTLSTPGMAFSTETFADARREALLSALSACSATVAEVRQHRRLSSKSSISSGFGVEDAIQRAQWRAVEHELFHRAMRSFEVGVIDGPGHDPLDQLLWNHLCEHGQTVTLLHWFALPAPLVVAVLVDEAGHYLQASRASAATVEQAVSMALRRLTAWQQVGMEPPGIDSWFHLDPQRFFKKPAPASQGFGSVELSSVMTELSLCPQITDITPSRIARMTPARTVQVQWKGKTYD